jgi:RNase H-like domain found in reverse transcriptase
LGHKCSVEGRLPEENRVQKILNWPILTTPKEVRGFLGLCGTVRIWIKGFSELTRPLTELYKKGNEFKWGDKQMEAYNTLKKLVASAPALRPIDYESDLPVFLSVDTSYMAVGFILSQLDENGKRRPA